jgi:hypothetical protein
VPDDTLMTIAAMQREGTRANGKVVLSIPTAVGMLTRAGIEVPASAGHIAKLLRDRNLDVNSQRRTEPVQPLAAPHPNHTHEIDASLCLLYYMKGRQHLIREDTFYKNKLDGYAKIQAKLWRYVCYDRASGVLMPRCYEIAGENKRTTFEFMTWAWGKKREMTPWGAPKHLLWDKGPGNTDKATGRVLAALEVDSIHHATHRSRVKGGVENAQNLVETKFESQLRFEPVGSVEELNAALWAWAEAFNANRLPGEDSRLHREGIDPIARYDLWHLIREEQIRELPPIEVLRGYAEGPETTRKVRPDLTITYRHPGGERPDVYEVKGLDGVNIGATVEVRPLVFGNRAIHISVARYDGEPLIYRLEPSREYDVFGNIDGAPRIGEEYKGVPLTDIDRSVREMDRLAYPAARTRDDILRAKQKGVTPFNGEMRAISSLHEIERIEYMPRAGSQISVPDRVHVEVKPLTHTEAAMRLRAMLRGAWTPEHYARLVREYPDGVLEEELAGFAQRIAPSAGSGRTVEGGAA